MATAIIKHLAYIFPRLTDVREAWVASALFNDDGFAQLQAVLPLNSIQHYLIGIDLPTTVSVLRKIQTMVQPTSFEAKICKTENITFHPKVYLFQHHNGEFTAIVGSANLTAGGLLTNTELNLKIDDQLTCTALKQWFEDLYKDAFPLDDANIGRYEQKWLAYQKSGSALSAMQAVTLVKPASGTNDLDNINFSDRYFKKEHHLAFRKDFFFDYSKQADQERKEVSDVFAALHQQIYPRFKAYGLKGLYPNVSPHLVSMYYHDPSRKRQALDAMWLSYGKSEDEIKRYHKEYRQPHLPGQAQEDDKQSFINHARLQIRIEYKKIGIWILFAKNNGGGVIDRNIFREQMARDLDYREKFYRLLKELPEPYWISVRRDSKLVSFFNDVKTLHDFCKKDDPGSYFIIGRDYDIPDPEMTAKRLPDEVLKVFNLLFPLYQHTRHYFN